MVQLVAFALVGVMNSAIDFLVYVGLTRVFEINLLVANAVGFMVGAANSYVMNGRFTFRSNQVPLLSATRMLRFGFVNCVTLGCSTLIMWALVGAVPDLLAKAVTLVSNLVVGFLLNRALVFRKAIQ